MFLYSTSLVFNGYRGSLPGIRRPKGELDLHFMPRLRMSGAIVYSFYMLLWRRQEIIFIFFMFACVHVVATIGLSSMCCYTRSVGEESNG